MSEELKIRFRIMMRDKLVPVDELLIDPKKLLDHYLSIPRERLTCCSFQGGFCIDVNGKPWNGDAPDDYCIDEFWMTLHWLMALEEVLTWTKGINRVTFWEESQATITVKDHGIVWIEDTPYAREAVMLEELAALMLRESRKYVQLVKLVNEEMERRKENIDREVRGKIIYEMKGGSFEEYIVKVEKEYNAYTSRS